MRDDSVELAGNGGEQLVRGQLGDKCVRDLVKNPQPVALKRQRFTAQVFLHRNGEFSRNPLQKCQLGFVGFIFRAPPKSQNPDLLIPRLERQCNKRMNFKRDHLTYEFRPAGFFAGFTYDESLLLLPNPAHRCIPEIESLETRFACMLIVRYGMQTQRFRSSVIE
jgi:hypothetical protein